MKDTRGEAIDHGFIERTTFVVKKDDNIAATLSSADDKIARPSTPRRHSPW